MKSLIGSIGLSLEITDPQFNNCDVAPVQFLYIKYRDSSCSSQKSPSASPPLFQEPLKGHLFSSWRDEAQLHCLRSPCSANGNSGNHSSGIKIRLRQPIGNRTISQYELSHARITLQAGEMRQWKLCRIYKETADTRQFSKLLPTENIALRTD